MGRLRIVYPICCGMDVHRDFVIACIASTNAQGVTEYQSRRFSTYTGGLRDCAAWLAENKCKVAIARRLLTAIYQMLLKDEPYQPCVSPVQENIPKQRVMTAEDALAMLRRKGYILVDAVGAVIEGNVMPAPA